MNENNLKLITAVEAAYRAGLEILDVYDSASDMEITYKEDDSPLTVADRRSHEIIHPALKPLGIPILSEEGRSIPYEERQKWGTFWLVDPLDGTKEFIKRNGEFTVNIALIQDGRPVLGVVYVPVKDELYFGTKELGAYKIDGFSTSIMNGAGPEGVIGGTDTLFSVARKLPQHDPDKKTYVVVGSRSHATDELKDYIDELKTVHPDLEFISAGSSLKLCLVAEGKADEYPRLGPTMEWDTAAGQAIAECAGAKVLEFDGREPLQYNKENLLNPWFIVTRV